MRRKLLVAGILAGLAAWPSAVGASGDFGCAPAWSLVAPTPDCANRIVIGPGNDTRANLLLLLRDRARLDGRGASYTSEEWLTDDYGHTFFDWEQLAGSLYPVLAPDPDAPYVDPPEFSGTRCQSVRTGGEQFLAAAARNRRIGPADREALAQGREQLLLLCQGNAGYSEDAAGGLALPHSFASPEAREFGTYLAGAAAFYASDWRAARERFTALRTAKDEWVRETALYMLARSALGEAADSGVNEWGDIDPEQADKELAIRADGALGAYLEAYPAGRYAASADGLTRRARWFGGDLRAHAAAYARLLGSLDAESPDIVALIDEIDDKFLLREGAGGALQDPWLLATHDLMRIRRSVDDEDGNWSRNGAAPLSAAELAAQQGAFAGQPELYAYLKASYAYYIDRDYRSVLQLVPDDARKAEYSPLEFSGQVLRGMALAELGDRNEAGFWQELLGGAKGLYQRPTVELGLALNWEKSGQVAKVFAPGSPIEDQRIRAILLEYSSGPEVLRAAAQASGRPQSERDLAAYVLLYKELSRGQYADALRDLALVRSDAPLESYDVESYRPLVPAGLFARGRFSDGYPCPALRETVARLARNADDVKGRLCLGEFYRLNGFDEFYLDYERRAGELGSFARFPGERIPRSRLYDSIIAEPGVSREDRAYALYRAIHCYAPSGYSSCGGDEVPEEQRRAWFRRLKGEFAATRWAREAEYYW